MSRFSGPTRLTLFACLLAFVVVALGAFTRLTDAGLGCPDWPGCYGHLTWPTSSAEIEAAEALFPEAPVDTDKTWPEMVHRYFAASLGLVLVALAALAWKHRAASLSHSPSAADTTARGQQRPPLYKLSFFLVLLVTVQALFGMWTVTLKLWPQVVTAHLLGGFATLALLWLLFLRFRQRDLSAPPVLLPATALARLRGLALLALMLVIVQITLGGWTSSNYAALACIDLPTCHGEWLPAMDFARGFNLSSEHGPNYLGGLLDNEARTAIHVSHRLGALVVSVAVLWLALRMWRTGARPLRRLALSLTAVLVLQFSLGVTNILAMLPLAVAVAHNAGGALLLLTLVTVNYYLRSRTMPVAEVIVNAPQNLYAQER